MCSCRYGFSPTLKTSKGTLENWDHWPEGGVRMSGSNVQPWSELIYWCQKLHLTTALSDLFSETCVCVCVQWGHFDWSSHLQKECLRVKTWGYLVVILEFFWNGFRERHPFSLRVLRKMVKCVCVKWKRRPVLSLRLSKPHSYCWNGTLVQRRQTYNKENTQLDFWQMRGCFQAVQQFIRRTGLNFS